MKKLTRTIFAVCAALFSAAAMATPASLGFIEHLYGTDAGRQLPSISSIYHGGGNCDIANANSMTVKATKSTTCNRFADDFDFSSIDYDGIDYFELTMDFTGARNQSQFIFLPERWNVRAASNYVQSANTFGPMLNGSGIQTFTFDNTNFLFNDIVNAENFFVSFETGQGPAMNFNLKSAKLEVFGTPMTVAAAQVPEPGSLALLGLSLAALAGVRRVRKPKTV